MGYFDPKKSVTHITTSLGLFFLTQTNGCQCSPSRSGTPVPYASTHVTWIQTPWRIKLEVESVEPGGADPGNKRIHSDVNPGLDRIVPILRRQLTLPLCTPLFKVFSSSEILFFSFCDAVPCCCY